MKQFWESLVAETAGDAILTGYTGSFKDMPIYNEVMDLAKGIEHHNQYALDFGCGVGRNSVGLAKTYNRVMAYDLPNMISLVPEENKLSNIVYSSEWNLIKSIPYDMVLASLVFQHIHDDELNMYLSELKTDKLVLHSRTWMDDTGTEVLTIVNNYFNIEHIEYQKDPNGNQNDHFLASFRSKNA